MERNIKIYKRGLEVSVDNFSKLYNDSGEYSPVDVVDFNYVEEIENYICFKDMKYRKIKKSIFNKSEI